MKRLSTSDQEQKAALMGDCSLSTLYVLLFYISLNSEGILSGILFGHPVQLLDLQPVGGIELLMIF